ncbi:YcxB family protein [bacterium]|nr:MAG: YcxB family protein [bacterium]
MGGASSSPRINLTRFARRLSATTLGTEPMTIQFTTTNRDLLTLTASTYVRSPWTYLVLLAYVVVTLPSALGTLDPSYPLVVGIISATIMEAAFVVCMLILATAAVVATTLISGRTSLEHRTMTFDGDALTEQTPTSSVVVTWQGVHKVVRTGSYILVYLRPSAGYPIPRRAVSSEQEWESLYALIRAGWASARA